jgi:hypothetical protein
VHVGGVVAMSRSDPAVRLRDYRTAITWWDGLPASAGLDSIAVCENSGCRILREDGSDWNRIEVLSWDGQDFDRALGKGFGEMETLRTAIAKLAGDWQGHDWIIKCNGRYRVPSVVRFCRYLRQHPDLALVADMTRNQSWCDSRFFAARLACWQSHILPTGQRINDTAGYYFEHALAAAAHRLMADGGRFSLLPFIPAIHGASGSMGHDYHAPQVILKQLLKRMLYPLKRTAFRV